MTLQSVTRNVVLAFTITAATIVGTTLNRAEAVEISAEQLASDIASANTPAEHAALAAHFQSLADQNEERAVYHEKMMNHMEQAGGKQRDTWERHCSALVRAYRAAEAEARALAKEQEELAKQAPK